MRRTYLCSMLPIAGDHNRSHTRMPPPTTRLACAACECMEVMRKLPSVKDWAKRDTLVEEQSVLQDRDASPHWKPSLARRPRTEPDALTRFSAVGVYSNVQRGLPTGGTVRAQLTVDSSTLASVAAVEVQHAAYGEDVTFPYDDTLTDVRVLQLVRDVAHLLHAGAFRGRQPTARVTVHPATLVLFRALGLAQVVPMGVLLGLYVWAHAEVAHPGQLAKRGVTSKPWHAAVAVALSNAWLLVERCSWRTDAGVANKVMSVLAALPRMILLQKEAGMDENVWARLMQEGFCSEVSPILLPPHSLPPR